MKSRRVGVGKGIREQAGSMSRYGVRSGGSGVRVGKGLGVGVGKGSGVGG